MTKRIDAILKKYDTYMKRYYLDDSKIRTCAFPGCVKTFPHKGTREFCTEHSEFRTKERNRKHKQKLSEEVVDGL